MAFISHWTNVPTEYVTKCNFLSKVTGHKIVAEQERISVSDSMVVVATQPHPRLSLLHTEHGSVGVYEKDGKGMVLYDCFIYYKVKKEIAQSQANYKHDGDVLKTESGVDVTVTNPISLAGAK